MFTNSGWDFSSRWFADGHLLGTIQTTNLIPVDLNCLLYVTYKSTIQVSRNSHALFTKTLENSDTCD
jgi:neutral trehalase